MATASSSFTTPTVTSTDNLNPVSVVVSGHSWATGDVVGFQGLTEMTELNGNAYTITKVDSNIFTLDGVDGTDYTDEVTGGADKVFLVVDISGYLRTGTKGENITVALSGTYTSKVHLERSLTREATSWEQVLPLSNDTWDTDNATISEIYQTKSDNEILRLRVTSASPTGTVTASLTDSAKVIESFVDDDGNEIVEFTEDGTTIRGTLTVDGTTVLTGAATLTAAATLATGTTVGNLTFADGSITDSSGAIDFGDETLTTTGQLLNGATTAISNGALETGVTAVYHGDGTTTTAVLTLNNVVLVVGTSQSLRVGVKVFTLPAGDLTVEHAAFNIELDDVTATGDTPDIGLGTVLANGAGTDLSGTSTFENIIAGVTASDMNGTTTVAHGSTGFAILTGQNHTVYFNAADAWQANGDKNATVNGTIVLKYRYNFA